MSRPNDYDLVADLYDTYVRVDRDIPLFVRKVAAAEGPVLELMAGTGRISAAIAPHAYDLTCLDRSTAMLRRLAARGVGVAAVCADVRAQPFRQHFSLVLLPFQSFSEVTEPRDREEVLREMVRVLRPGGRIVVTLHNPEIRKRSLDGVERLLGRFTLPDGATLEVRSTETLDASGLAVALQTYRIDNRDGTRRAERTLALRFVLIEHAEFEQIAAEAGLITLELLGDYDGSPFESASSPYMIWTLQRT